MMFDQAEYQRRWYRENRDRLLASRRTPEYRAARNRRRPKQVSRSRDRSKWRLKYPDYAREWRLQHRSAYATYARNWRLKNPERDRNAQFDRKIRGLPDHIKDMRRTMLFFKRWLKANGYTLASFLRMPTGKE